MFWSHHPGNLGQTRLIEPKLKSDPLKLDELKKRSKESEGREVTCRLTPVSLSVKSDFSPMDYELL